MEFDYAKVEFQDVQQGWIFTVFRPKDAQTYYMKLEDDRVVILANGKNSSCVGNVQSIKPTDSCYVLNGREFLRYALNLLGQRSTYEIK